MTCNALEEKYRQTSRITAHPFVLSLSRESPLFLFQQFSWTDYVRLVFADRRSPRRKPRKGLIKVLPSVFVEERVGGWAGTGGDLHRIKFFAASESETRDGRARSSRSLAKTTLDISTGRRSILFREEAWPGNRKEREVVYPRVRNLVHERYMRRRTSAGAGTYIFRISDFERDSKLAIPGRDPANEVKRESFSRRETLPATARLSVTSVRYSSREIGDSCCDCKCSETSTEQHDW